MVGEGLETSIGSRESASPPLLHLAYRLLSDGGPVLSDDACGNGLRDPDEECDDGDGDDHDGCLTTCKLARCGDGIVRRGVEECDDGEGPPDLGCTAGCLACEDPEARQTAALADGTCFAWYAPTTLLRYVSAEDFCEAKGGTLASFRSAEEQVEVMAALVGSAMAISPVWIGLSDRGVEGDWRWESGADLLYADWGVGEGAGGVAESCLLFDGFDWADRPCSGEVHEWVCRRAPWHVGDDGHAYRVSGGRNIANWRDAQLACRQLGADHVVLTDQAENDLLVGMTHFSFWIGLSEVGHPGRLAWTTGESTSYQNFVVAPGSLDGDEWCVELDPATGGWTLVGCAGRSRHFACEAR
jgi:cysteine-rich repeat protein